LQRLDATHEIWFNNQGMKRTLGNNMKVQLAEFFMKKGLNFPNLEVVAI
jgi:hypothetical protein